MRKPWLTLCCAVAAYRCLLCHPVHCLWGYCSTSAVFLEQAVLGCTRWVAAGRLVSALSSGQPRAARHSSCPLFSEPASSPRQWQPAACCISAPLNTAQHAEGLTEAASLVTERVNKPFLQPFPGSLSLNWDASLAEKGLLFWPPQQQLVRGLSLEAKQGCHTSEPSVYRAQRMMTCAKDFFWRPAQPASANPYFQCIISQVLLHYH